MQNAASLGATTFRADTLPALQAALQTAKAEKNAVLIYVPVEAEAKLPGYAWWDVPMSGTSGISTVRKARSAYEQALRKQKFYY